MMLDMKSQQLFTLTVHSLCPAEAGSLSSHYPQNCNFKINEHAYSASIASLPYFPANNGLGIYSLLEPGVTMKKLQAV